MKIAIYQIAPDRDKQRLIFRELSFVKTICGNEIPSEPYELVFSGEVQVQTLEDVFYIFNMAHPEGYKGRSLSISDVVETISASGDSEFFFCDTIGFQKIGFQKNRAPSKSEE